MSTRSHDYGRASEDRAARYLQSKGYKILDRNYRCRMGEVDLIAEEGETLVFVEVKARRTNRFGSAKAAVDRRKQIRIAQAAQHYLKATGRWGKQARFDVVAITSSPDGDRIEVIRNAFSLPSG